MMCSSIGKPTVTNASRGDYAFTTWTFGAMPKDASEEDKRLQRLVATVMLNTRKEGHNGVPVVFPKIVMLVSQEQMRDPEQQKLFMTALECSSRCMYP